MTVSCRYCAIMAHGRKEKSLKGVKLFSLFLTRTGTRTRKPQLIIIWARRSNSDFSRVWHICGFGIGLCCTTRSSEKSGKESLKSLKTRESLARTIVINTGNWVIHSVRSGRKRWSCEELGFYQSQGQRSNNIYLCRARVGSCSCLVPNVLKFRSFPENNEGVIRPLGDNWARSHQSLNL